MNEMIERVARALYEASDPDSDCPIFDDLSAAWKWRYCYQAAKAVAAMREPTENMRYQGWKVTRRNTLLAEVWRAMIDAALKDQTAPPPTSDARPPSPV